jgi:hypothetical protein
LQKVVDATGSEQDLFVIGEGVVGFWFFCPKHYHGHYCIHLRPQTRKIVATLFDSLIKFHSKIALTGRTHAAKIVPGSIFWDCVSHVNLLVVVGNPAGKRRF